MSSNDPEEPKGVEEEAAKIEPEELDEILEQLRKEILADGRTLKELRKLTSGSRKSKQKSQKGRIKSRRRSGLGLDLLRDVDRIMGAEGVADSSVAVFGNIPAFATGESMLALSLAQGELMLGAVANQQRVNALGMATTSKCVSQMLEIGRGPFYHEYEDEE